MTFERMMFVTGCFVLATYLIPVVLGAMLGGGRVDDIPPKPRRLPPAPPKPPRR